MKKPPARIALLIVTVLFLYGCNETSLKKKDEISSKPDLTNDEIRRLVLLDTSFIYPEKQARANALNLAAQFLNKRDGINRSISNLITVGSLYSINGTTLIKTDFSISKPQTPSLYIYNFKGAHGYVILSADTRAAEILATVGSGNIDSLAHPGLRIFLSNAVSYIDRKVAEMESYRGDAAFQRMLEKLRVALLGKSQKSIVGGRVGACQSVIDCGGPPDGCVLVSITVPISAVNTTTYIAQPLLTTLWDQKPPYNNGQPNSGCLARSACGSNYNYLAGCVPVAEGQVVAHFQTSPIWQSIDGKICQNYTPDESNTVATLLHNIYLSYGIYVARSCDATGAGLDFGDIHFTDPRGITPAYGLVQGHWRAWNTSDIRNSLSNGSPVIIEGMQHLCCFIYCWGCGDGHEWVIDGMRDLGVQTIYQFTATYQGAYCDASQQNYYQSYTYTTNTTTATQIHQNWGWGGGMGSDPSDWYAQDVFMSNVTSDQNYNFNHANYIVAYITPN